MLTILTAGTGLGVYLPGLIMQTGLAARGLSSRVLVLESLFTTEALKERERAIQAFQADFRLASLAHRRSRHEPARFELQRVTAALDAPCSTNQHRRWITWSGFWLPLLAGHSISIDHCRIDAEISASFQGCTPTSADREVWLWRNNALHWRLPVDQRPAVPWHERELRMVIHGGGWSLGAFDRVIEHLPTYWTPDVLIGQRVMNLPDSVRVWRIAPDWQAWKGTPRFPPMATLGSEDYSAADIHQAYELLRSAHAIVSKPGGCTLIESLSAATPLLWLEPFGRAEAANAALWERLGLGMPLADWLAAAARPALLQAMHERLLALQPGPNYLDSLAREHQNA